MKAIQVYKDRFNIINKNIYSINKYRYIISIIRSFKMIFLKY